MEGNGRGQRGNKRGTERDLTLGGESTMQCADDVL